MLWRQCLAECLSLGTNHVLNLEPEQRNAFSALSGTSLQVVLLPVEFPIALYFSDKAIDIQLPPEPLVDDAVDCTVKVALSALDKIRDTSQLTALIKADKLDIQGDLSVLQKLSSAMQQVSFSWESLLIPLLGESFTAQLLNFHEARLAEFKQSVEAVQITLAEGLVEEKKLIAPAIFVADYCDEVSQLRVDTDRFQARLKRFEQQRETNGE